MKLKEFFDRFSPLRCIAEQREIWKMEEMYPDDEARCATPSAFLWMLTGCAITISVQAAIYHLGIR